MNRGRCHAALAGVEEFSGKASLIIDTHEPMCVMASCAGHYPASITVRRVLSILLEPHPMVNTLGEKAGQPYG